MKTPLATTRRDPLFDVVKAVMMLLVVWGHLGLWGIVAQEPGSLVRMANAKIGVNMPIFFVLVGYLALSTFEKGSWSITSHAPHTMGLFVAVDSENTCKANEDIIKCTMFTGKSQQK